MRRADDPAPDVGRAAQRVLGAALQSHERD
jgi:hypothetical protein